LTNYHFACSEEAGRWLFGKSPFTVINNAIDISRFHYNEENRSFFRAKYHIPRDAIVIGCVGHLLESHKNQSFLIRALQIIHISHPSCFLFLVGDGVDRPFLEKTVKEKTISNVIFAGNLANQDFYSCFDVFALPSFHEGNSIACLEAIANGLYCVISNNVPLARGLEDYEKQLSLASGPSRWSEEILRAAKLREKLFRDLKMREAGFDIRCEAEKLQEFYLKK